MSEEKRRRTARPRTHAQLAEAYPISIVIPARNASATLGQCLDALLVGELSHVEIVVVDDASDDDTGRIVEQRSESNPVRLMRSERRLGPANARNRGWRAAAHPWVLFVDADVVLPSQAVQWVREGLDLYSHRPEVGGVLGVYAEKIPWRDFFTNYKNLYTCFLYRTTETLSPFAHTAIFCVGKEILREVGGFDGRLATAEDFRLGVELGTRGCRFVIDRRIAGVHLKRWSLAEVLKEDCRRIADLRQVHLTRDQRLFYYRAHRWSRLLSVALPAAAALLGAASLWEVRFLPSALVLAALFYLVNFRFLNFCRRRQGWIFALKSALFLFVEMLWAGWCAALALTSRRRMPEANPSMERRG